MKLKAISIVFGICLAVLGITASSVYARSTSAFGSFHVQSATVLTEDQYLCLTEDNGAVVNHCAYPVNLYFDLPIDTLGRKTIDIQDYWGHVTTFKPFNCVSYVYSGKTSSSTVGTQVTFTASLEALMTEDDVTLTGDTLAVICWQVPPGEGIAKLNWNE